jgi:hypothetical protein
MRKHPVNQFLSTDTKRLVAFYSPEHYTSSSFIMAPTIVLVTGANRGLGLGLVKEFVAKPDYVRASFSVTTFSTQTEG